MAENTQTFVLVGQFKDGITPSLKKLDVQIKGLTKSFEKFSRTLRPISKELGIMAAASERLALSQKSNRSVYEGNVKVLREYKKTLGDVGRAQKALTRNTPRSFPAPAQPTVPGAPGAPRGGRPGPLAQNFVREAGESAENRGVGFWGMTAAMATANLGVQAATAAFNKITGSAMGFVQAGSQAEQAVIQMAGTLQTLGKMGDFGLSRQKAEDMMGSLSKVAAALPGSTNDYLTILQQTLDDQIQAFGSVEAVTKNLAGYDVKTGQKLAGGMEQSFTALFGMASQLAGLRPQIAAMDLNQLRQSPENIKNIQVLTRNPTLAKFYLEELKKSGGDFILALNEAMKKAITPEQIEALKNSFDSAYQSFVTTFTDPYSGVFAPMRKVKVKIEKSIGNFGQIAEGTVEASLTTMDILGVIMRNINDIVATLMGTGIDPLVALNQFLYEFGYQVYKLNKDLEYLAKDGLKLGEFAYAIGDAIGKAAGDFSTWLMNLDYEQFFKNVDELVFNFFKGLFDGFLKAYSGIEGDNKGPLGGLGTSVSGTIITLGALSLAISKVAAVIGGIATFLAGIQFSALAATIAGWAPVIVGAAQAIAAGVATFATTMALPLAAIVGAILGVVAILRHGDFIISSLWEAMKLLGNGFMWMVHAVQEAAARLMAGVMSLLSKVPLIGHLFKGQAEKAEADAALAAKRRQDREKAMAANAAKIADNTAKSWERTKGDFKTIGNAFSGATKAAEKETLSLAELTKQTTNMSEAAKKATSTYENNKMFEEGGKKFGWAMKNNEKVIVEWGSVLGTSLKGVAGAAENAKNNLNNVKPQGTPTMTNRNYTVGGVTYDWKTGMPVKAGTPSTPAPAGGGQGGGRGSGARPTQPAANAGASLAPVTTAVNTGTAATQAVNASTQQVRAAVQATSQKDANQTSALVTAMTAVSGAINARVGEVKALITSSTAKAEARAMVQQKKSDTMIAGINNVKSAVMAVSGKIATQATLAAINSQVQGINQTIKSGKMKVQADFNIAGGPLGGGNGGPAIFGSAAQKFGLTMTSGYRPGDPGYHGINRARDYSNSSGPTPQMMMFAKFLDNNFGRNLKELIYTPLGYSIKNGKRVPPYAQAAHYNHVHVAWAHGPNHSMAFPDANSAISYEKWAAPTGAKIASITANSSEFPSSGGTINLTQNVSIDGAGDPAKIAEAVWEYTAAEVQKLQYNLYG